MKKLIISAMVIAACMTSATAWGAAENGFFISLQGGPSISACENTHYFGNHNATDELFTLQGQVAAGFRFTDAFGIRLAVGQGKSKAGGNANQSNPTSEDDELFYPASFNTTTVFLDLIYTIPSYFDFNANLYAGVGMAHTSNWKYTSTWHGWMYPEFPNTVMGARVGCMPQFHFDSGWSIFADIAAEIYADKFDGLDGGVPVDIRGLLSLGFMYTIGK